MLWDQISFVAILSCYFLLNLLKFRKEKHWLLGYIVKFIKRIFISSDGDAQQETNVTPTPKSVPYIKQLVNSYASFNSSMIIVGFITETYLYGGRLMGNIFSVTIGYLVAFFLMQPLLLRLSKESVKTPYEYFERRYNGSRLMRRLVAFLGLLFHVLFSSLFLWTCTTILCTVLPQINLWISQIVLGAYSLIGVFYLPTGYRQSLKIGVLQMILFLAGITGAVIITLTSVENGWSLADQYGRLNFIFFDSSLTTRYTIWNQLFALPIPWCVMHVFMQPTFVKYRFQMGGFKKAQLGLIVNLPFMFGFNFLLVLGGICAFIYYNDCDPIAAKLVRNKNQIASYWILNSVQNVIPGLAGVCLASIIGYGVVHHSNGLANCKKIILGEILILKDTKTKLYRALDIVLSVLLSSGSIALAYLFEYSKNSALSLFFLFNNSFNSIIFGSLVLAAVNPFANWFGASVSLIIDLCIVVWLGLSSQQIYTKLRTQEFQPNTFNCSVAYSIPQSSNSTDYVPTDPILFYMYSISSIWYCLFSLIFIVIVGSILSLLYSVIRFRRLDADSEFSTERRSFCVLMFFKSASTRHRKEKYSISTVDEAIKQNRTLKDIKLIGFSSQTVHI